MGTILIDKLLSACVKQGASDLHITVGQPPVIRHDGHMVKLKTKVLEATDTMQLMKSIAPDRCQQELQAVGGADFGFAFGDLARFLALELGHGPESVLKKVTLEDNFKRVNSASDNLTAGYGIGFAVERHGSLIAYGHGGSVAGYLAGAFVNRASGFGMIALRNVSGGPFNISGLVMRSLGTLAASRRASKP